MYIRKTETHTRNVKRFMNYSLSGVSKISFFLAIRSRYVLCWSNLALPLRYTIFSEVWDTAYDTWVLNGLMHVMFVSRIRDRASLIPWRAEHFSRFTFENRGFLPFYTLFARAFFLALLLANLVNIRVQTRGHVRARKIPWNILIVANRPSSRSVPLHPPSPFCNPFLSASPSPSPTLASRRVLVTLGIL